MRARRVTFFRRRKFHSTGPPTFFELGGNLDPVTAVFKNWTASYGQDPATGEQRIFLKLTQVSADASAKFAAKKIGHAKLGDLYYRIRGGRKELGVSTDWLLYLSTSGETTVTVTP